MAQEQALHEKPRTVEKVGRFESLQKQVTRLLTDRGIAFENTKDGIFLGFIQLLSSYYFGGSSVVNINAGDIGPQAALSTFLASPDLVIDPQSKQRISLETYLQSQFKLIEAAGYQISIETKTIAEILSDPDSLHPPSDSFTKGTSEINPNTTPITTLRIVLPDNRSLLIPFLAVSTEQNC